MFLNFKLNKQQSHLLRLLFYVLSNTLRRLTPFGLKISLEDWELFKVILAGKQSTNVNEISLYSGAVIVMERRN